MLAFLTNRLWIVGVAFAAGVVVGAAVLRGGHEPSGTTKVEVRDEPIPKELTKPDVELPNPSEIEIYQGLKNENQELRQRVQQLRAEYLAASNANLAADSVVGVGEGLASTLSEVCTRAVEARARVGLSPLFQANAGINVLLAVFARQQQREAGLAENRRFVLLPIDVVTNNPILKVTRSETRLSYWDTIQAAWIRSTYRHPVPRTHYVYAGAGTILRETGMGYGPAAGVDVHAGRLRLSAEGVLDLNDPKNSVALTTAMVGF